MGDYLSLGLVRKFILAYQKRFYSYKRMEGKNLGQPWYIGDSIVAGIGQGYLKFTMIQLAAATSTLPIKVPTSYYLMKK